MTAGNGHTKSAFSTHLDSLVAAGDLVNQLQGHDARAILFFASHKHDGALISRLLREKYPKAEVIGCTTAGEFTERHHGEMGVSALALGPDIVLSAAGALADVTRAGGVTEAVSGACRSIEQKLGVSLRDVNPQQFVGFALVEGLRMREESINEALGNQAPLLSFVGGSAGDNLDFKETRVFCNGAQANDGAALLVLKSAVPFHITKTCSFESTGHIFKVTKADVPNRVIYELDGKPVLDVYAKALGISPEKIDSSVFMASPMGLLIDNKPWIRSPQQVLPDRGLKFYCQVLEGMQIHVMRSTNLVQDTRDALARAAKEIGKPIRGGLAFNCILRRLEIDARNLRGSFYESFKGMNVAGFHTYGESWLGHINQTLTAVLFT